MNMILIDCQQLNQSLIDKCQKFIKRIIGKIKQNTTDLAGGVIQSAEQIKSKLQEKPTDAKQLVDAENYLEDVRTERKLQLIDDFKKVVDWLCLIYDYPLYEQVDEDEIKPIYNCHTLIEQLDQQIEQADAKLKIERKQLEEALILE